MDHLLSLFNVLTGKRTSLPPPSKRTKEPSKKGNDSTSSTSTKRPTNLTTNASYRIDGPPSLQSASQGSDSEAEDSQSNNPPTPEFCVAFGGREAIEEGNIKALEEEARHLLLRPALEDVYSKVSCSQLSRHTWSHVKDMEFESKKELNKWIRRNWKIEVLHKTSLISSMKTAGTKDCRLCMQEKINLFHAFRKKKYSKGNLLNSKTEMYGQCSCKTRFLRLVAVGDVGADEATS
jgi:hypothetical protein